MSEHDCGGWCSAPDNAAIVQATRDGGSTRGVARMLGIPLGTIVSRVSRARRDGCLPAYSRPKKDKTPAAPAAGCCRWCGNSIEGARLGTYYCKPTCARNGRDAGINVKKRDGDADMGPEHPMLQPDEVGIRRRLKEAAEAGVDSRSLHERFRHLVGDAAVDAAISKAASMGRRDDSSWPLGLPA